VEQPSPEVVDYIYMIRAGRINMFWQPATLQMVRAVSSSGHPTIVIGWKYAYIRGYQRQ
jgi:hypothetical protein